MVAPHFFPIGGVVSTITIQRKHILNAAQTPILNTITHCAPLATRKFPTQDESAGVEPFGGAGSGSDDSFARILIQRRVSAAATGGG